VVRGPGESVPRGLDPTRSGETGRAMASAACRA